MADITTSVSFKVGGAPQQAVTKVYVITPSTTDTSDTFTVTLSTYGLNKVLGVLGWTQSTADSVFVQEQPTTAISAGVMTVTVGGSSNTDKVRAYEITGY